MFPHKLLVEKEMQLNNCGRVVEDKSILGWKRSVASSKNSNKGSKKAWEEFVQWLRNKNFVTVKDF